MGKEPQIGKSAQDSGFRLYKRLPLLSGLYGKAKPALLTGT
jgi:hypothetical protein